MPLKDLFDYISKEWNTLTAAPVAFILVFAFAAGLSWWVINWIYKKRFETLKQRQVNDDRELTRKDEELKRRSQHYEERLARKDEEITAKQRQIDEYRERLGILEAKTKYHSFPKSELKDRALVLVNDIRYFLEQVQEEENHLRLQEA